MPLALPMHTQYFMFHERLDGPPRSCYAFVIATSFGCSLPMREECSQMLLPGSLGVGGGLWWRWVRFRQAMLVDGIQARAQALSSVFATDGCLQLLVDGQEFSPALTFGRALWYSAVALALLWLVRRVCCSCCCHAKRAKSLL